MGHLPMKWLHGRREIGTMNENRLEIYKEAC
jgi:hypothetical protein